MLVYSKLGEDNKMHLYGTVKNVPAESDEKLYFENSYQEEIEDLTLDESYITDSGAIIRAIDGSIVNAFIVDEDGNHVEIPGTSIHSHSVAEIVSIARTYLNTSKVWHVGDTVDASVYTSITLRYADGHAIRLTDSTSINKFISIPNVDTSSAGEKSFVISVKGNSSVTHTSKITVVAAEE